MQKLKEILIDCFKTGLIVLGIVLVFLVIGFLTGATSQQDKSIEYFNNIDYAEQQQIEYLIKE